MPIARVSALRYLLLVVLSTLCLTLINPPIASTAAVGSSTGRPQACRQMLIYPTNYYGPVQRVQLSQSAANIKHMYWYKKTGGIQRLLITYNNDRKQEIRLMWNPDAIKGFSFWCHTGNQCVKVPGLENQEYILNFMAHFKNQPTHLSCSTYKKGGFPGQVIFNNFNGNGVDINPPQKTTFHLNGRCRITEMQTFHHNRYRGKVPGKIFIRGINGTKGSWAFKARPGLSSWQKYFLPNCNWIVNPANLVLGPGDYEIDVSDRASWSHNPVSKNQGYAIVWGTCQAAPPPPPQPSPWTAWRGHNYRVITTKMTWNQAQAYAQKLGGHLVTISDQAENQFVSDLARAKGAGQQYWIGFTDQGSEGRWRWVNNQKITYTNWHSGEPNNAHGSENCAEVGYHSKYTWNDTSCGEKNGFVVEAE
ncbi:MAG: C-type lectin domain-containing protein [Desulfarculaceae bacterium]|nr:C-type lectin domain-containing protein [Desulfarculaceae bacterium]